MARPETAAGLQRSADVRGHWLPEFAGPECREPVWADGPDACVCRRCVLRFEREGGIFRFLTPRRAEAFAPLGRQVPEMAQLAAWNTPLEL